MSQCLCCHASATKAEDEQGFTLCDSCFFKAFPASESTLEIAAICAEQQLSEAERLLGELLRWKGAMQDLGADLGIPDHESLSAEELLQAIREQLSVGRRL